MKQFSCRCLTSLLFSVLFLTGFQMEVISAENVKVQSTFTLWQLPPRTPTQHMAYVIRTSKGKVIVVDGGNAGDAEYLQGFLGSLGNHVHAWFLSHPHPDHVDALTKTINSPGYLIIDQIFGSLPEESWVQEHEPQYLSQLTNFKTALETHKQEYSDLSLGQVIKFDDLKIEVLGIKNPEIHSNAINNSSIVFRVSDSRKSVLFTGDLGVQGGQKLLKSKYRDLLKADYVQMAHHGQNGVDFEFYKAVQPRCCLWPTPAWLWNNDSGKGINSGTWQTLIVRDWMDQLQVEKHFLAADGLIKID